MSRALLTNQALGNLFKSQAATTTRQWRSNQTRSEVKLFRNSLRSPENGCSAHNSTAPALWYRFEDDEYWCFVLKTIYEMNANIEILRLRHDGRIAN